MLLRRRIGQRRLLLTGCALLLLGCSAPSELAELSTAAAVQGSPEVSAQTTIGTGAAAGAGSAASAGGTPTADSTDGCPVIACVSVVVTGDVLLHPPLWEQAEADGASSGQLDFGPLLAAQAPYLAGADLAICHLETPVAAPGAPFQGYPTFSVPPQIVPALAATGYDACSTASNHTDDQGESGIDTTLDALDAAGIAHAGSYRTEADAARSTLLPAPGGTVALIAATYALNTGPADHPWDVELIDVPTILAQAAAARAAGADLVIVALHAGVEYNSKPTATQREVAAQLLASPDVDFVYGHHAHVVQPLQQIGGKWVAFGLGNTVAAHGVVDLGNREGLLLRVQFGQAADGTWSTLDIGWVPSLVDDATPYRWCPLTVESRCSDADGVSRDRISTVVNSLGAAAAGAHEWQLG